MIHYLKFNLLLLIFSSCLVTSLHAQNTTLKFMLITQREANDPFWGIVEDVANAAAKQLEIKLYRRHALSDRNNMLDFVNEAARLNIDAIIFPNFKAVVPSLLKRAEEKKINTFLFNAGVRAENRTKVGKPREKYTYWLGYSLPDDEHAGYLLAKVLLNKAKQQRLQDSQGKINVVGITGTYAEVPSLLRVEGLKRAIKEDNNTILNQVVFSDWKTKRAAKQFKILNKRYPQTAVYWGASDSIGIGIFESASSLNLRANTDYISGGIDWSLDGLNAVKDNKMLTSIGGHIFEGAWAVIMLYDYLNGIDFKTHLPKNNNTHQKNQEVDILYPMFNIQKNKLLTLKAFIENNTWDQLNFKKFSLFENPSQNYYDFSPHRLF